MLGCWVCKNVAQVHSRVVKGWEFYVTGSWGIERGGQREVVSDSCQMVNIELLQHLKSQNRIGKFFQSYVLKLCAKSMKSRVKVGP
jgi:hypothetical protein